MRVDGIKTALVSLLMVTSTSVNAVLAQNGKAQATVNKLSVPKGFKIQVFADNVPAARSLAISPAGTVFVGTNSDRGPVYALVDRNKDGKADERYIVAENLVKPNGVAFRNGSLYVAQIRRVIRFDNIDQHLKDTHPLTPVVINNEFPKEGHHGWKFIRFGPDDLLYVPVGAPCNVCADKDPFAAITRIKPDGSGMEVYARGIRNTVGFDWHPVTKQLWFTENGRDWLGDNTPPDELNCAPQKGMHFGFPYRLGNNLPDPEFGSKAPPNLRFTAPAAGLGPHVAALGMRFYTGKMFPKEYQNQIFYAEHGSWNSRKKVGYRVCLARLDKNKVKSVTPFVTGFLQSGETILGRPVDVQVMPDGALLVSDDQTGAIYRISYEP